MYVYDPEDAASLTCAPWAALSCFKIGGPPFLFLLG